MNYPNPLSKNSLLSHLHKALPKKSLLPALLVLAAMLPPPIQGAVKFWDGSSSGNWATGANWNAGTLPVEGDDLVFPAGVTRLLVTNNFSPNRAFNSITFGGSNYFARGSALLITNGITSTNPVGPNTIDADVDVRGTQFWTATGPLASLDFNGDINLNSNTLTVRANTGDFFFSGIVSGTGNLVKTNVGTLRMDGSGSNSYSGFTRFDGGVLELAKTVPNAIPGDLTIGDGNNLVGTDVCRLLVDNQIADTSDVTVKNSGLFDLNDHDDRIASLTMQGGTIDSGTGTLILGGNVTGLNDAANNVATINGTLSLGGATRTFDISSGGASPDMRVNASIIPGTSFLTSAGIIKNGAGTLEFDGTNTYNGTTTINDSQLAITADRALGTTTTPLGATAGTVINGDANLFLSNVQVTNEALTINAVNSGGDFSASGASIWTGNIVLNTNTFISSSSTLLLNGTISGVGGFTKLSAGSVTLAGTNANTYTGTTTVKDGTLLLDKDTSTALDGAMSGPLVVGEDELPENTDIVRYLRASQLPDDTVITLNSSGLLDLNGFGENIGDLIFNGGDVDAPSPGSILLTGDITVNANINSIAVISGRMSVLTSPIINVTGHFFSPDLRIDAELHGAGGFTKNGIGEMTLTATNTYTGLTTINAGTLTADGNFVLGSTVNGTVVNGTAALILNDSHITNEVLTLNSTNPNGALQDNATADWIGSITLGANVVIEASSLLQLGGAISGAGGFTKVGASTLRMIGTAVNTYAGTTIVQDGLLELNRNAFDGCIPGDLVIGGLGSSTKTVRNLSFINQIANTANVTINTNGLLDLNGFLDGIASLDMTGGAVQTGTGYLELIGAGGGVTTHSSSFQASISGTFDLGGQVRTFDIASGVAAPEMLVSAIVRNGGVTKVSSGNLRFSGANTYAGLTTISSGFLEVNHATALGSSAAGTVLAGASAHLLINGVSVVGEALTNNSSSSDFRSSGPSGWSGNIVLNAQLDILPFGTTLDLSGVISGSGAVTKSQTGILTYSGASGNTYTNTTTVTAGTLLLNKSSANNAILGELTIGDGVGGANADVVRLGADNQIANSALIHMTSSGLFDLNSNLEFTGAVDGSGQIDLGVGGTFEPGGGNGTTTYTGLIVGSGTIFKLGTGTWTLTGNNTYTGTTTVSAGTLLVNGSQQQTPVVVNGTATLGGSGTIGNLFVFGNLTPGASPGILTCSNFTCFSSASDYFVELTGPAPGTDYDQLNVRGTNALASATLHVTAAFASPVAVGQKFVIINNDLSEAITGTFNGLAEGATIATGGYKFIISYLGVNGVSGNDVVLTLTNIPSTTVTSTITSGNGNHFIDPNECNSLSLVISNQSGSVMSGITAMLSTTTPGVIITQPHSGYPNLAINGKGTNNTPFQISTLSTFVCGTDIELQLIVNSSAGSFIVDSVLQTGSGLPSATPIRYDVAGPLAIPDPGILNSVAAVTGFTGPLTKVGVSLWLTHPVDGDLSIGLVSPDGVIVDLSSGNGGSGDDYGTACSPDAVRTTFDDGAALTIGAIGTAPPFVGTFKPESPLGAVLGGTINGNWTLRINDTAAGGAGSLRCWSLFLYPMACSAGGGSCDYCIPAITGLINNSDSVESNRVFRTFTEPSSCGIQLAFPGNSSANIHYDLYTFTNTSTAEACVTVQLSAACDVQAVAYLNSFDPANVAANYLGDSTSSTATLGGNLAFSVSVPAGAKLLVVVNEIISGGGCGSYTLQLSGLPCPPPVLAINSVSNQTVRVHWPTSAGGYKLEATASLSPTNWAFVTNEPIVVGGRYNVTNTPPPTNRFYRLQKP